jgi:hypothetical protein
MSRTIVGTVLAFALAITPVFYCAQSWAGNLLEPVAKDAEAAAPKVVEEAKALWKDHRKEVGEEAAKIGVEVPVDISRDCFEKARKGETCRDTSE